MICICYMLRVYRVCVYIFSIHFPFSENVIIHVSLATFLSVYNKDVFSQQVFFFFNSIVVSTLLKANTNSDLRYMIPNTSTNNITNTEKNNFPLKLNSFLLSKLEETLL